MSHCLAVGDNQVAIKVVFTVRGENLKGEELR